MLMGLDNEVGVSTVKFKLVRNDIQYLAQTKIKKNNKQKLSVSSARE